VWLVPFALFVSLSAGESAGKTPAASSAGGTFGDGSKRRARSGTNAGMAKAVVNGVREWVGETGEVMGFWRGEKTRSF